MSCWLIKKMQQQRGFWETASALVENYTAIHCQLPLLMEQFSQNGHCNPGSQLAICNPSLVQSPPSKIIT